MSKVKALVAILAVVIALPVAVAVGMALGPAALVMLFVFACCVPVLLVERIRMRRR